MEVMRPICSWHPSIVRAQQKVDGNHSRPAFGQTHAMSESFLLPFHLFHSVWLSNHFSNRRTCVVC